MPQNFPDATSLRWNVEYQMEKCHHLPPVGGEELFIPAHFLYKQIIDKNGKYIPISRRANTCTPGDTHTTSDVVVDNSTTSQSANIIIDQSAPQGTSDAEEKHKYDLDFSDLYCVLFRFFLVEAIVEIFSNVLTLSTTPEDVQLNFHRHALLYNDHRTGCCDDDDIDQFGPVALFEARKSSNDNNNRNNNNQFTLVNTIFLSLDGNLSGHAQQLPSTHTNIFQHFQEALTLDTAVSYPIPAIYSALLLQLTSVEQIANDIVYTQKQHQHVQYPHQDDITDSKHHNTSGFDQKMQPFEMKHTLEELFDPVVHKRHLQYNSALDVGWLEYMLYNPPIQFHGALPVVVQPENLMNEHELLNK